MNVVEFPGINLKLNVPQITFEIFGVPIYNYAICIVLGVIVALILCRISKNKFDIEFDTVLEHIVYALLIGVIGARLYFVVFNLDYYLNNPSQIFNFRDGGLAIYGGLIFGAISLIVSLKISKVNFFDFLDRIVPYVALAQCFGRWGNFFNVEAYGTETSSILRMGIIKNGVYTEVHPTFFYESIFNLIIFIILSKMQKTRKYKGQILLYYLAGYGLIRMIIEGLRVDSLMFLGFRVSQVLSLIIFIISIIFIIINNKKLSKDVKDSVE